MIKHIRSNSEGQITYNIQKDEYYIEFGNVYITLDSFQYEEFKKIVKELDPSFAWANENHSTGQRIRIPFESDNVALMFTAEELMQMKDLLGVTETRYIPPRLKIRFSMN
jgi:hypothetical protein